MRADILGCLGNRAKVTPNMDRIVKEDAIAFSNAFCQNPVCVPSRCSFLTGLYPHVFGHRTMEHPISEVKPIEKEEIISHLPKDKKHLIAIVGDGVNDALALTTSDIGIAIGGGTDIAIDSSDIVLIKNDLMDVVNAIKLSKRVYRTIIGNLFWAFFYNCIGILLATGLFVPFFGDNFKLTPMIGSACMAFSSIFVVLNALTINFFKPLNSNINDNSIKTTTTFEVSGMMCEHCVKRVEDAIKSINGVEKVSVLLKDKKVIVVSKNVDPSIIISAIKKAGYSSKKI